MLDIYEELKKKLPPTFLDADLTAAFASLMVVRTQRGKREYPEEYKFDPLVEAQQECLDIGVYAMILYYRIQQLRDRIDGLESKTT